MARVYKRGESPYWQAEWYDLSGQRYQRSTQCTDRRAAEARLREWERDAADPTRAAARATTLRTALEALIEARHQDARAGQKSHATVSFYAKKSGHLLRVLGETLALAEVTAAAVDRYIAQRRGEGSADSTVHKELVTLRGALRLAKRRGLWAGDIEAVMPRGFSPRYRPRERWLTATELEKLLEVLADDRAALVAWTIAVGAEWSAVGRARRADYTAEAVHVRGTKRETRDRVVPVVFDWQRKLLALALAYGSGTDGLWHRPWGNVRRDLHAACARAGIEPCTPNDLRRTFGHWMRAAGLAPSTVGAALGHADGRMAERVYARLGPSELAAAMRREGSVTECHNSVPQTVTPAAFTAPLAVSQPAGIAGFSVPRDGIEPPTRGFSVPVVNLTIPRRFRAIDADAAPRVTKVSAAPRR